MSVEDAATEHPVTRDGLVGVRPAEQALTGQGGGRRRGGGRGGRGEQPMVPDATFTSYYGRPVVKPPVWEELDIAGYFFLGGLGAGASLLAAGANATGRPVLRAVMRTTALTAGLGSFAALVHDLGKPARFYQMLRVAKPTSPMSVGVWILMGWGPSAGLAAVSQWREVLPLPAAIRRLVGPVTGSAAGVVAAAIAPVFASYTAVLAADTAVPTWHEAWPELPVLFVGSAAAAAGGLGMAAVPSRESGPARRLALLGAAVDLATAHRMEKRMGLVGEPLGQGRAGALMGAAQMLNVAGLGVGLLAGRRSRAAAGVAGAALLAGSVCTRFGVFAAGIASARDPRYTVIPQRERLEAGRAVRGGRTVSEAARYLRLTTYRPDGSPVPTPVWFAAAEDDSLLVVTGARTGKVDRIRAEGRVEVAVCTARGKVRGPALAGTARVVPASEVLPALQAKYGVALRLARLVERLTGRASEQVGLQIQLTDGAVGG